MDWTLEVVVVPVSDLGRAIAFHRDQAGFELDHDTEDEHVHVAQLTPRGVGCSEVQVIDERDGGTFFGFADPDGDTWAVQQIRARADRPLIPVEARGRFGDEA